MALEDELETKRPLVAVHSGTFHADDVFAVASLKILYPNLTVIRTRNPTEISNADIRVDVGGAYNHEQRSYDHHQKGGAGERENRIPYAAIGLIWKHYGERICDSRETAEKVDESFIQKIDAADNGLSEGDQRNPHTPYSVNQTISNFNPAWYEDNQNYDEAFQRAVGYSIETLVNVIKRAKGINLTREIVKKGIQDSEGKPYITLERFCPWSDVLGDHPANYIIFPDQERKWVIRAIPGKDGELKKPLSYEWAGASSEKIAKLTGVEDFVFCHNGRHLAKTGSREGAERLAEIACKS